MPYHAGNHWGLSLTEFLRKPWYSFETARLNPYWPERPDKDWFIEEAKNILRLRTQKIEHLLNLRNVVENVSFVNYESIRDDNGLLEEIAHKYLIKLKYPSIRGEPKHLGRPAKIAFTGTRYSPIGPEDLEFIRRELDWEVEGRIGYHSMDYQD